MAGNEADLLTFYKDKLAMDNASTCLEPAAKLHAVKERQLA